MQLLARKPIADLQPQDGPHSLKRVLGAGDLIMLAIGAVIGAGIFVLPALVAQGLGAAAPLAFLVCAAIMALLSISLAVAGSRVTICFRSC